MTEVTLDDFLKIELRVGTIIEAQPFPEARKPAVKLWIDFGDDVGIKKSSAQITAHYNIRVLKGKQVVAVTNFLPRQIGEFMSEVLVTGFSDTNGDTILISPDKKTPNGQKLH